MKKLMGVVVGVNLAVACALVQGCKAPRAGAPAPRAAKAKTVAVAPAAKKQPAPLPPTIAAEPIAVPEVKPLPPAPVAEPAPAAPQPAPEAKEAAPLAAETIYVVKPGDVLSRICRRHGVSCAAVVKLNPGLKPDRLHIGQKIKLPVGAPIAEAKVAPAAKPEVKAAPAAKPEAKAAPKAKPSPKAASTKAPVTTKPSFKSYTGPTKEYVVVNGDNVGKIAYSCGISIRAFKELNGLKSNNLSVGQKLKVPAEKQTLVQQVDAPVAKKAEAKKDEAKKPEAKKAEAAKEEAPAAEAKPVEPAAAPVATVEESPAAVPAAGTEEKLAAAAAVPAPAAQPALTHVVKEGEDLVTIAINYGASLMELKDLNGLADETVKPGQVLKLPAGSKPTEP